MTREYLGHPRNRWPQRFGTRVGTQATILLVVAFQLREVLYMCQIMLRLCNSGVGTFSKEPYTWVTEQR